MVQLELAGVAARCEGRGVCAPLLDYAAPRPASDAGAHVALHNNSILNYSIIFRGEGGSTSANCHIVIVVTQFQ